MPRSTLVLPLLLILFSCRQEEKDERQNTRYLDQVFHTADSLDRPDAALALIDSVYRVLPGPSSHDLYRMYDYKRYYYQRQHNYEAAEAYADSMLSVTREGDADYCLGLFDKGDALMGEKKYNEAFQYYVQAKRLTDRTTDTCGANIYSTTLGTVCYKQRKYDAAVRYFLESYGQLLHCRDQDAWVYFCGTQGTLDNIALGYTGEGLLDSARFFYDSARSYIASRRAPFDGDLNHSRYITGALGVIDGNEGDVAYRKGDTVAAEALYLRSINLNLRKNEEIEDAQLTSVKLARLYMDGKRFREAALLLDRLRHSLDTFPSIDAELDFRQTSWQYNERIGAVPAAYRNFLAYTHLKDSLEGGKPLSSMDVGEEIKHAASNFNLRLLQRQYQVKTLYLFIATTFAVMALLIIGLVIQNAVKSRKHVDALTVLNQQISTQNYQMHTALNALEQSHRENARLLKIMAHDLRNPIGASGSIASLLLEEPDFNEEHRQMLQLIRASSQSSLEMITDLLHSSTTRENLVTEPVDLKALLTYCAEQLRFKAEEKRQTLRVTSEPVILSLNREKMWRVLSNLLTNAIKFSPSGTAIFIDLYRRNAEVWIAVCDQGIGIPGDLKGRVFELFGEAKRKGTAGEESFGLGLGISKQIVEAHGGRIWFDSEEGRGTTFFIAFPDNTVS
jgi:signal transduction histidine kinase